MPFGEHLTDLDELLLGCRDQHSKTFLAEAIACYRAGAYRSAIITTWIAVVFDLIGKMKELALMGNTDATQQITIIEHMYETDNVTAALAFERNILKDAREKFQLFSFVEEEDLKRLFADRNRCSHPSLRSLEEPYQPSGELVRTHICNAVTALLQHPSMQGRHALNSILETIASDAFPIQVDRAIEQYFRHSPLMRSRTTLKKDVITVLSKDLLLQRLPEAERARKVVALQAVLQLFRQEAEDILSAELPKIVRRVSDYDQLFQLVQYLSSIPSSWYVIGDAGRDKVSYFLEEGAQEEPLLQSLPLAMRHPELSGKASAHLPRLEDEHLAVVIEADPQPEYYLMEALQRWGRSDSFQTSTRLTKQFLAPFLSAGLKAEHVTAIILACQENSQLYDHFTTMELIRSKLFPLSSPYASQTKSAWQQLYEQFSLYIPPDTLERRSGLTYDLSILLTNIEDRYSDTPGVVKQRLKERYAQTEVF